MSTLSRVTTFFRVERNNGYEWETFKDCHEMFVAERSAKRAHEQTGKTFRVVKIEETFVRRFGKLPEG